MYICTMVELSSKTKRDIKKDNETLPRFSILSVSILRFMAEFNDLYPVYRYLTNVQ